MRFIITLVAHFCCVLPSLAIAEKPQQTQSRISKAPPKIIVAKGLNADGSLVKNYRRGLEYAIDYFGNYGPYYVYLLGPGDEENIRAIYQRRAETRVNRDSPDSPRRQVMQFLNQGSITEEIKSVLAGHSEGGLTWTQDPPVLYEDVTTNATQREKDPVENTWGALHEYHHVFQMAHCDTKFDRDSDKNLNSWMSEGMASYSSAKFMENLGLIDFQKYMLELRTSGGNIGRPGIKEFLEKEPDWDLAGERYWEEGEAAQVYYMLGAWATAYLIHVQGVEEQVVLREWYYDIPRLGKAAAFEKHMGLTLADFYQKFARFIQQPDPTVMAIFN